MIPLLLPAAVRRGVIDDREGLRGRCQSNAKQSQMRQPTWCSGGTKLAPFRECGIALELEGFLRGEVALLIEVVVDRGMGGCELLQATHPPEALHRPLSSPQRLMGIFDAVVQPAACALAALSTDGSEGCAVGAKPVGHDDLGSTMPLERLPQKFQHRPAVPPLADEGFEHLTFMIDGAPQVMRLALIFTNISSRCNYR
jgi:hypothetical protein